jgi:GWxTD domain-containing protein
MKKIVWLTFFFGIFFGHQHAGSQEGARPLQIQVDYARFRGGDDKNLFVEVYYSIPQKTMYYRADSTGLHAEVIFTLVVSRGDSMVYGTRWLVPHTVADTMEANSGRNLVGLTSLTLPEGEYALKVIGQDRYEKSRIDSVVQRLTINSLPADRMILSDIELASTIHQGNESSQFYKNTLEVVPNVQGVYSEDQMAYLYLEAYNLGRANPDSTYRVRTVVFDAVGREVISRERPRKRVGESSVLVDNIAISQLRTGTYTLVVALLDTAGQLASTSGKKFFVYNQSLGVDSTLLAASGVIGGYEYSGMEEPAMDQEFDYARYTASGPERDQYEKLEGRESKAKFLREFWARRGLGVKEEYLARIAHANASFRALGREGYRTDRGRVYTIYGPPDDYERHPSDAEARPYEIWSYNSIQGGVIFVFVQRSTGGDYDLVHSTHRNELHDENWERFAGVR